MASSGGISDQLFVAVKLESPRLAKLHLAPHLLGSHPVAGSWDPCKALPMVRADAAVWELSCVVPSQHGELGDLIMGFGGVGRETLDFKFVLKPIDNSSQCIVEEGPNRSLGSGVTQVLTRSAVFKIKENDELECKIWAETEMLSPFDLAASWRAHQGHFQGTHDAVMNAGLESRAKNGLTSGLELDLEKYVVPTPNMGSGVVYAANLTENPRSLVHTGSSSNDDTTKDILHNSIKGDASQDDYANIVKNMPAAEGAVAAAAVADQMYGPKEDRKLTIVLVGLPARGKTFTAAKLTRYLRWLGHETKHFNVGKYRRLKHGTNQNYLIASSTFEQTADFFRGDNKEGVEARNEVAALAMEDMLSWMQEGGQVGIFDATNSTRGRRNMLMKMAEGKCKIIFLETICKDPDVLERNIRLKVQQSPDYAEQTDFEAGVQDFKERLAYYEKVYEPVEEGSYIKMIDMVSGSGGQLQKKLSHSHVFVTGELSSDTSSYPANETREAGELYSRKLASFVEKRLKSERTASVWTSTLQRTILTAHPIIGFPKIQWRALDEINAGICDGMTYDEIKKIKPDEYELEPVIIELERQRSPVVVISHQAVLRALYAYFADKPLEEVPNIEVPLHTIIEIQMGVAGVQEKRYKLMDAVHPTAGP
ncbi:hypothetical protein PR202_ga26061 [Eleusine coracana subsp. coracana]|uniref:CBM20 domain-containing protein n=1 Tax=Eleusine coracana subsp. coracana TaxID=191504 RepID=A0AAV5DD82_ELECO|nr:hypothetical protein PR202_ga26061 [Eleusine coracana subsp. coracana]